MSRVVRSYNGSGQLVLRSGEALPGRYHIDVSYQPVRRVHEALGHFRLDAAPGWGSVVEAQFAGDATLSLADNRQAGVTLGGVLGDEVSIVAMDAIPEDL